MSKSKRKNVFDELYHKVYTTARSRFYSARRLTLHDKLSQWTITLTSIVLLIIPLVQVLNFSPKINPTALNILEIFFAVVMLAFSLLISSYSYSIRSERMHRCGLELASIYRALEPYRIKPVTQKLYENFCRKYDEVLANYENHEPLDYLEFTLTKQEENYSNKSSYFIAWINFQLKRIFSIMHYLLLLIGCIGLIYFLIFTPISLAN